MYYNYPPAPYLFSFKNFVSCRKKKQLEEATPSSSNLNLNYDFKTQRVALVTERGVITSAYLALRPDEQLIDAEYATYLFKGYESKMALHNMGAGIRLTLGYREFKNQPVLFPTLCEQRKIVTFLDRKCAEIDAVIERTKATIEEYKKLKQAVITEAVTKGVRGPRPMKDSGIEWIGEIPKEWSIRKLFRAIDAIGDIDHYMPESVETGIVIANCYFFPTKIFMFDIIHNTSAMQFMRPHWKNFA
ncbi:MAG: hypothetical protein SPH82_11325 [Eubacteriales bacterium]|nr:hypothetical protein [Eubacteriales bacterium]